MSYHISYIFIYHISYIIYEYIIFHISYIIHHISYIIYQYYVYAYSSASKQVLNLEGEPNIESVFNFFIKKNSGIHPQNCPTRHRPHNPQGSRWVTVGHGGSRLRFRITGLHVALLELLAGESGCTASALRLEEKSSLAVCLGE